ncbi:hypothetical protein GOC60_14675 [Sinorhizobium meliloti]|nr:hypothetical protein [Sinorhizobium meliloti]
MEAPLDKDTMAMAPFGYVSGRPRTRYEFLLERELERRKTRQSFIIIAAALNAIQFAVIVWLVL